MPKELHSTFAQDPVPWNPKGAYKRFGQRVIITRQGDLAIRPTFLETKLGGGTTLSDHCEFCQHVIAMGTNELPQAHI